MKKLQLFILILVVIVLFAFADHYVNVPEGMPDFTPALPSSQQDDDDKQPEVVTHPNVTKQILDAGSLDGRYAIEKRTRSTELFESFNLSEIANISIYKNILIDVDTDGQLPIYIYEIHGPAGQGGITYLNIKLAIIAQLGSSAGINETGSYGYNSLFYNSSKDDSTGYLLSQVEDIVFGFKYPVLRLDVHRTYFHLKLNFTFPDK